MGMFLYTWYLFLIGIVSFIAYEFIVFALIALVGILSYLVGGIVAFYTVCFLLEELSKKDNEIRTENKQKKSYYA